MMTMPRWRQRWRHLGGTKSNKGASRRQHKSGEIRWRPAAGNTIINDHWTAGNGKESCGQAQTTTNQWALKVG